MFIDIAKISLKMKESNEALLKEEIRDAIILIKDDLMLIELSISVKDDKQVLISLERVKSFCKRVYLDGLYDIADDVEKAIHNDDLIVVEEKFTLLQEAFKETMEAFDRIS